MFDFIRRFLTPPLPQEPAIVTPSRDDAPRIFARLFSGDDGQKVLSYLRVSINNRVAGPDAAESVLRYYDGQRALLQTIHTLIEQGKN